MEKLVGYQPGGHHPIHLGDELCNGRFRVIHKLGFGGSSIVWLCRDQSQSNPTYVAVKILVAHLQEAECRELRVFQDQNLHHLSRYFCFPKEQFTSESPNGTHLCLVLPLLGPTVNHAAWIFNKERDADGIMLRQVSRSLVEAVASLHSYGIYLRPANVVLELQSLDGLEENQVLEKLGEPKTQSITIREDCNPTPDVPYAPKYMVQQVDFHETTDLGLILPRAVIIDFGQAVMTAVEQPPFGIPTDYAAPEVIWKRSGGREVDTWSLACTLYEVRVGKHLFEVPHLVVLDEDDYEYAISSVIGERMKELGDGSVNTAAAAGQICKRAFGDDVTAEQGQWAEMLAGLLRYEPHQRPEVQELLKNAWFDTP
ncbi:Protein kinase-like domain protein, partial [Metarhizium hybridum]